MALTTQATQSKLLLLINSMMFLPKLAKSWTTYLAALLAIGMSSAHAISISPVRLSLEPKARMVTVVLGNSSDKPTQISVKIVRWQQDKGYDLQLKQTAFLASPQAFILPPKQLRPLRIGLVGELSGNDNEFYQVRISESRQDSLSNGNGTSTGVTMTHVLPLQVFRNPNREAKASCISKDGSLFLANNGPVLIKAKKLSIGDVAVSQTQAWAPYVLPGQLQPVVADTPLDPATQRVISIAIEGMEQEIACPL